MHPDASRMNQSPRCGARTRCGSPCRSPAVKGKRRCRISSPAPVSAAEPTQWKAWFAGQAGIGVDAHDVDIIGEVGEVGDHVALARADAALGHRIDVMEVATAAAGSHVVRIGVLA